MQNSHYAYVKEWRKKNKEKVAEYALKYAKKHPETNKKAKQKYRENNLDLIREKDKLAQAASRKNNPEGQRRRQLAWRQRKEVKLTEIAGRPRPLLCEVCNEFNRQIVFDHCHVSEIFRGWLCDRCNKVLGLLKDDIILFRKLADYLEIFNEQINNQGKE